MLLKRNNVRRVRDIRGKKTRSEGLVGHIQGRSQLPALQNPPKNNTPGFLPLFIPPKWALFVGRRLGTFALFTLQSRQYCRMDSQFNGVEIPGYGCLAFYICMFWKSWTKLKTKFGGRSTSFQYINNVKPSFCKQQRLGQFSGRGDYFDVAVRLGSPSLLRFSVQPVLLHHSCWAWRRYTQESDVTLYVKGFTVE